MKKVKIAIVGGGSVGLFISNLLLEHDECDVSIFEKNNKLGKKILASGNGKCNFTNVGDYKDKYNNEFANYIVNKFNVKKTLEVFSNNGLIYKKDSQNRCYPVSESSNSVLDVLKQGLKKANIYLDSEVRNIYKKENSYLIEFNDKKEKFDYVVCCSGSAASNLGSNKAYDYLEKLNIKMEKIKGSLAPVIVKENIGSLKGVRIKCLIKLFDGNDCIYLEDGEVMFKDDALSGIAIFNASNYINRKKGNYKIVLDLSYGMNREEIIKYFKNKDNVNLLFKGYLNDKLADYIIKTNNISNKYLNELDNLYNNIKSLTFNVIGVYDVYESQVCSGGVCLDEVNERLELKKLPNMYVGGELLDIDGMCGGYNLQFAWSSAGVIANDILNKIGEKSGK